MVKNNFKNILPAFGDKNIAISLSSSDYYVPYLGTCISSIISSSNKNTNYDILIIESNISELNKKRLTSLISNVRNISIRFLNVNKLIKNINFYINGSRVNMETYFGLLLPWLLPDYNKIITMDCDMIVNHDLSILFNLDIKDYLGAGVKDVILQGFLNEPRKNWKKYYKEIGVENPYNCFNGGLVLINLEKMRKKYTKEHVVNILSTRQLKVLDQDIFNILMQNSVKYLDLNWNHLICPHPYIKKAISISPIEAQKDYFKAQNDPYVIHYAGDIKPWNSPEIMFADHFWREARKTIFYEEILSRMVRQDSSNFSIQLIESGDIVYYMPLHKVFIKSIKKIIDRSLTIFFPKESKQRHWLSKFYRKMLKVLKIK